MCKHVYVCVCMCKSIILSIGLWSIPSSVPNLPDALYSQERQGLVLASRDNKGRLPPEPPQLSHALHLAGGSHDNWTIDPACISSAEVTAKESGDRAGSSSSV